MQERKPVIPPLNSNQKFVIREATKKILHYAIQDLPKDTTNEELAQKLKAAFNFELKADDPLAPFQDYIKNPATVLPGCEKLNVFPLTFLLVRQYIFKITRRVIKAARTDLLKDKKLINKKLTEHIDAATQFITPRDRIVNPSLELAPYETPPELLFKGEFEILFRESLINFIFTFELDKVPYKRTISFFYLSNLEAVDDFIDKITPRALTKACLEVASHILHILNIEEPLSKLTRKLLAYRIYFEKLQKDRSFIAEIRNISQAQFETLTSPEVICLLENSSYTVSQVKNLPAHLRKLIVDPFYFSKIIQGEISLNDVMTISTNELRNVSSFKIILLIKQGKINFQQAKNMTAGCRILLENPEFFDLFQKGLLPFDKIKNINLNIEVLNLVCDKVISLEEALTLDEETVEAVAENPFILFFIQHKILHVFEIKKLIFTNDVTAEYELHLEKGYDLKILRMIMKDFLELAENGLMIEEDLVLLYHNLDELYPLYAKEMKGELKREDKTPLLLRIQCIKTASYSNLQIRLIKICYGNPFILAKHGPDNLKILIQTVESFKIHTVDIWADIFAVRVFGIFLNEPFTARHKKDDIEFVVEDLGKMSEFLKSHTKFYSLFLKNLIKRILDDLKSKKIFAGTKELEKLVTKMNGEYSTALIKETAIHGVSAVTIWPMAFKRIADYAQAQRTFFRSRTCFQTADGPQQKKYKLGFFTPEEKLFSQCCVNLCKIAKSLAQFEEPKISVRRSLCLRSC